MINIYLFILFYLFKLKINHCFQDGQSLDFCTLFRKNIWKTSWTSEVWKLLLKVGWMDDPWEQTVADPFCSTHLVMLTFSKKPIPKVNFWQMSLYDTKSELFLLTHYISTPEAVFFFLSVSCSMALHVFKMEMDCSRGGWNQHEGQHLTAGSQQTVSRRWCGHYCVINSHENHRLAGRLTSLPPPTPLHTDNYRSPSLNAMLLLSVEIASCCLRARESDFN